MQQHREHRPDRSPAEEAAGGRTGSISRRGLLGAGVWSLPVVAIAIATPARAASGEPALVLAITNGEVGSNGMSTVFAGVNLNEPSVPLILDIRTTNPDGPASGPLSATLAGDAAGIATWDGSNSASFLDTVVDGGIVLPLEALGYGTFTVVVAMGAQQWVLSVAFTA